MIAALIKAANIEVYKPSAEPFAEPMRRQHAVVVGGCRLDELAKLFPKYAVEATVVVPQQLPAIAREYQFENAVRFEAANEKLCRGVGIIRDLSGIDTDCADILIISTTLPAIRNEFLGEAWRVTRELGKVVVFTADEIPVGELSSYGLANAQYFGEGFHVGTMRKYAARLRQN